MPGAGVGVDSDLGVLPARAEQPMAGAWPAQQTGQDAQAADAGGLPGVSPGAGAGRARQPADSATVERVQEPPGRPKEHDTDGQACMQPSCEYYKDTDGTLGSVHSNEPQIKATTSSKLRVKWRRP